MNGKKPNRLTIVVDDQVLADALVEESTKLGLAPNELTLEILRESCEGRRRSEVAPPTSRKEQMLRAMAVLPDDATFEEGMDTLDLLLRIEQGLADEEAGRTISHEEVRA